MHHSFQALKLGISIVYCNTVFTRNKLVSITIITTFLLIIFQSHLRRNKCLHELQNLFHSISPANKMRDYNE